MTPYIPDPLPDNQLSFISHIIALSCGIGVLCVFTLLIIFSRNDYNPQDISPASQMLAVPSTQQVKTALPPPRQLTGNELKSMLHANNLWEIGPHDHISPLVISSFPENLDSLSIDDKKRIFLHALLPIALTANQEIDSERLRLFDILASSGALPGNFKLSAIPIGWQAILSDEDLQWLESLQDRYNAKDIKELKRRIQPVPVSLIMAQGALESSWGTSRFAREGNNLFGLRTYGDQGIIPEKSKGESTYLVATYNCLLESVHAYLLTLNSHRLYTKFRDIRLSSQDPVVLSKGLLYYSEKRKEYISQVNRIIKYNSLKKFDTVQLSDTNPQSLMVLSKK